MRCRILCCGLFLGSLVACDGGGAHPPLDGMPPGPDATAAVCGDGVVGPGETCDPPGTCPATCGDGNACTTDVLTGSASACDAACTLMVVTTCAAGDGCCPAGCTGATDRDCSLTCGDGMIDPGETCDPPASCPMSCNDGNACTSNECSAASGCYYPAVSCNDGNA